jgi:hypothetical protein
VLPRLVISRGDLEAALARDVPPVHHELEDLLARRPSAFDRRAEGHAVTRRILAIGEKLGAIEIV